MRESSFQGKLTAARLAWKRKLEAAKEEQLAEMEASWQREVDAERAEWRERQQRDLVTARLEWEEDFDVEREAAYLEGLSEGAAPYLDLASGMKTEAAYVY